MKDKTVCWMHSQTLVSLAKGILCKKKKCNLVGGPNSPD